MARNRIGSIVQHYCQTVLRREGEGLSDGQLLDGFLAGRDEAHFEALMRRHGPMVLGVCRRLLRNSQDVEDAFQATFLVLFRRGDSVSPREAVGNWLYGVAHRTALEARRAVARRQAREIQVDHLPHPSVEPTEHWQDLRPILDRELARLPDKYRSAVVLCDLEGRSRKEAARQLGLPEGTVSGRLTKARQLLASRLSRQGVALSASGLAALLAQQSASAAVSPALIASTLQMTAPAFLANAATALADSVVLGLSGMKQKAALLLLVAVLGCTGWITYQAAGFARPPKAREVSIPPRRLEPAARLDRERLQGEWVAVSCELAGKKVFEDGRGDTRFVFDGDRVTYWARGRATEATYRLDATRKPSHIDIQFADWNVMKGIYELDGSRLRLCWSKIGERPTSFDTRREDILTFAFVYEKKTQPPDRPGTSSTRSTK